MVVIYDRSGREEKHTSLIQLSTFIPHVEIGVGESRVAFKPTPISTDKQQITVMSGHVLGKMAVCTGLGRSAIDGCHPFIRSYIQNDRRELRLS